MQQHLNKIERTKQKLARLGLEEEGTPKYRHVKRQLKDLVEQFEEMIRVR